jgi:uncharacterized membrane protein
MGIGRQLRRWTEAGLLEPGQAEHIARFERDRSRPALLYAVVGVAAFAMAIGLLSIVAANWDEIPAALKLGVDLGLLGALGYAVARLQTRGPAWLAEAAIGVLWGLTLASIALVGQVYQQGGDAAHALLAWSVLTALLMSRARSVQLALLWVLGLELTYAVGLVALADVDSAFDGLALAAVYFAPLACLALGRAAWLERLRPQHARVLTTLGWAQLVLLASIGTLAFYERPSFRDASGLWLGVSLSALGSVWLAWSTPSDPSGRARRGLIAAAFAVGHLGVLLPHDDWPLAAALGFLLLWSLVALVAHRQGRRNLLHWATAVIGLRLLVVYFEVIGSLLDTGLALLFGGALSLVLAWLWTRQRKQLDRGLSGPNVDANAEERP